MILSRLYSYAAVHFFSVCVLSVCLLNTTCRSTSAQEAEPTAKTAAPAELWFGTLDVEQRRFRFAVELKPSDNGDWTGRLRSLDEGGASFQLEGISRDAEQLGFEIKSTGAKYSAKLDPSASQASGRWHQHSNDIELILEKVDSVPALKFKTLWTGKINAIIQNLDIAIFELDNGEVLLDSVSQKASGFVGRLTRDGQHVLISLPALDAQFNGTEDGVAQTLTGKWKQGLVSLDLVLVKSESHQPVPLRRPQTPQPPFPYQVREVEFRNEKANLKFAGTLTVPREAERVPAVVLISGSGPQDRDETIAEHRPFAVLADHLTRAGVAVLRFDDRGVGGSEGDFSEATTLDFASDVQAAVDFLRGQSEIDAHRIALCGHSEGGLVAPLVAVDDPQLACIVLMAGSGVNGAAILASQTRLILEQADTPPELLQRQVAMQKAIIEVAMQSPLPTIEEYKSELEKKLNAQLSELEGTARDQFVEGVSAQFLSPWFQFFLKHEPAEVLTRVRCPVLVICGEKDLQVDPQLNLPAIEGALVKGGNADFKIQVLPSLNHLFQTSTTGAISEYGEIEETIAPIALDAITHWLVERLK